MKESLTVLFQTVTPMFLAGANQDQAEMRIPSFKGALRFWYRAVDPEYINNEPILFGSGGTEGGQSRFWMKMESPFGKSPKKWGKPKREESKRRKSKDELESPLSYLSFSINMRKFTSYYLPEDDHMAITICRKRIPSDSELKYESDWRGLMAAVWLLGHVGGLGSRSRRGFGSLALQGMETTSTALAGIADLPIAHLEQTPEQWMSAFQTGLQQIQDGFSVSPKADHTVIDAESTFHLHSEGCDTWKEAMESMGELFREFRKRKQLTHRAAFGLPLQIQNRGWRFVPEKGQRYASPVWMRVVRIGDSYHPFIAVLSTDSGMTILRRGKGGDGQKLSVPISETFYDLRQYLKEKNYLSMGGL
ncbi:type III-B CRISPR module RAMP protein Cmr1 [Kroppenstedtia pulmonis]|uniref:Type III-B CRISPR module RAMP protein Cmr1 n=1 Tax=Kroppenstedtia pulmonis TaxID=1380685 RepID=A0A7D4C4I3_9BACL|nr:type III-B CRISPR module RAMP protein Cmr1 [Kroppenstedtia pulmonis]QKG83296.1 type III-B CRISPR module RAMP protein Cmr1 [Kroppenstedtia pulmonis]